MGPSATQDRATYLEQLLTEIHDDIDAARENDSYTAVARLTALAVKVRAELDAARPPKRGVGELSPAELAAKLAKGVRKLPPELLPLIEEALAERRVH